MPNHVKCEFAATCPDLISGNIPVAVTEASMAAIIFWFVQILVYEVTFTNFSV